MEELQAYVSSTSEEAPDEITAPYQAPDGTQSVPVQAPVEQAWTPDSGREPSLEELQAYSDSQAPPEPPPPPEPVVPPTPEEALRQTPGIAGFQSEEYLAAKNEEMRAILGEEPTVVEPLPPSPPVTPLEEIEPWDPESDVEPTLDQLRAFTGMSAADAPVRATRVNPVNLPPAPIDDSPGRTMSALGNFTQSAGKLMSSVPKAVQLWFAPDTDLLKWMDEMDRIDAMESSPERFDARVAHISSGMQKYGTMANFLTQPLLDKYIEGPKNKGETLAKNRAEVRAQYLDEMRKTVDRPLYKAGEAFDAAVRDSFPANPEYQDEWLTSKIPSGLGSVLGYMTVFALTKKPAAAVTEGMLGPTVAATATTAGIGVTTQQAFAFEEALTKGAEIDEAFDAAFSGYTTLSGMSEAVPISRFFGRADAASGGAIKKTLIRMFKQGGEESLQEGFQAVMSQLTEQELYNPEKQLWGMEAGKEVGEQALVGFTTGAIVEFLASMFPGRRRGTADRAPPPPDERTLQDRIEAARVAAAAEGGDALDQAEAASRAAAGLTPEMRDQQEATKERILADREARVERNKQPALAGLVQAESDIARLPFEQQAEVVARAVAEDIAAAKELAFARAEEEGQAQKAEEVKEAEYQQELQKGEAQEELGAQQEAAEAVQAEAVAPTIGDVIEPEVREGLAKMKQARADKAAAAEVVAPKALPAPAIRVTPEGEALTASEVTAREEARVERPTTGQVERPFVTEEPALPGERPVGETNAIVAAKAEAAATSPTNNLPEPTEAQVEAGNYQKGHLTAADVGIPGVDITIENPAGSTREGPGWKQKMRDHYGYIKRTESAEGPEEQLDVFVGDRLDSDAVFVVDQVNQNTGEFDEHKVMMGYGSQMDAVRAYKRNYSRKWKVGPVTVMTKEQFAGWLERGDQTKPINTGLRGAASVVDVESIAQAKGQVVRFRDDEGAPSSGSSSAAQAGMEVTPRSRVDLPFKDVVKRTPELQAAAKQLEAGEITREEFDEVVNQYKPIAPYDTVPTPATTTNMNRALAKNKVGKVKKGSEIEDGHPVGLRLDIPAYRDHGVWVPTIHENAPGKGKGPLSYEATAVIDGAEFREDTHAIKVATGGAKAPSAVIRGNWSQQSEAETMAEANAALSDPSWTQVGFDPERHSYFFDRKTGEPITSADRVIQVGGLVLAKNPKYGEKADYRFRGEEAVEGAYDFTNMTRADRASLATHLAAKGYSTYEAAKVIADLQKGDPLAVDDVNVQSWVEAKQTKVVRVKDAKAAVKPLTDELTQLKPVIVTDPSDSRVPETLRRLMRDRRAMRAKGAYFNGKLYIFAANHETTEDIVRTLLHEGVAHQGLRALFKNDTELNAVLDEVYASMSQAEIDTMRGRARAYANIDLTTEAGQRELAEEHIAHLAETDPQQTVIQQLVAAVRSMLRSVGMTLEFTNDDIVALLADARRELRKTVPLNRINVVSQVEVAETGEVVEVEERADKAIRQLEKRIGVIETLRGCAA
jgi:hypothetical protein